MAQLKNIPAELNEWPRGLLKACRSSIACSSAVQPN